MTDRSPALSKPARELLIMLANAGVITATKSHVKAARELDERGLVITNTTASRSIISKAGLYAVQKWRKA